MSKKSAIFGRWRHPLSITIPSVCLISERKRAIDDYRHLLQTVSLIIPFILFAVIITIHISCTGSRRRIDRVFAVTLESLLFGRWHHPLSITIPSVCLISERKRAIDDYRHLLQTMSLIIPFILFASFCRSSFLPRLSCVV